MGLKGCIVPLFLGRQKQNSFGSFQKLLVDNGLSYNDDIADASILKFCVGAINKHLLQPSHFMKENQEKRN